MMFVVQKYSSVQHDDWIIAVVLQSRWDSTRGITVVNFGPRLSCWYVLFTTLVGQLRIHDNKRNSVSRPMIWK
jgi:hypothetical protein